MKDSNDLRLLAPSILAGVMSHLEDIFEFSKIVESGFLSRKIELAEEEDKFILTLIYVQNYLNPSEDLDERVLAAIHEYLHSRNLSQYFMAINVNLSFLREERQV